MSTTEFTVRPASRKDLPLILGIAGPSGGGKTFSAIRIARGIAGDKPFVVVDTENGRSQMYADVAGPWQWIDFQPPFTPERYIEALQAAEAQSPPVIVLDSLSHEWDGDGGLFDIQEEFLQQKAGNDARKRDALSFPAWSVAKRRHKKMLAHILRMPCPLIVCMRAQDKIELVKKDGKLTAVPKRSMIGLDGWEPIVERRFPYELTASFLTLPDRPGIPRPIKLPEQLRRVVSLDEPLSERAGVDLGRWAAGDAEPLPEPSSEVAELTGTLLELAEQLEKRQTTWQAAQRHRAGHSEEEHVAWLNAATTRAHEVLGADDSPEGLFDEPEPAADAA